MKTIVETNDNNLSTFLLDDSVELVVTATEITVGNPAEYIIGVLNSTNSVVYEGVTAPEDWAGGKYFFDGTTWTLNPNWVDPTPPEELPAE